MSTKATKPAVVKLSEVNKIIENGKCYVLKCECVEEWTSKQYTTGVSALCPECGFFPWTSKPNHFMTKGLSPNARRIARSKKSA